jgi:hypothetical protein
MIGAYSLEGKRKAFAIAVLVMASLVSACDLG